MSLHYSKANWWSSVHLRLLAVCLLDESRYCKPMHFTGIRINTSSGLSKMKNKQNELISRSQAKISIIEKKNLILLSGLLNIPMVILV